MPRDARDFSAQRTVKGDPALCRGVSPRHPTLTSVSRLAIPLPPLLVVTPGDPTQSFLWYKINGTQGSLDNETPDQCARGDLGSCGSPMSLSLFNGSSTSLLPQADLDLICNWIVQGASAGANTSVPPPTIPCFTDALCPMGDSGSIAGATSGSMTTDAGDSSGSMTTDAGDSTGSMTADAGASSFADVYNNIVHESRRRPRCRHRLRRPDPCRNPRGRRQRYAKPAL
jgi:hypothetical protein